MNERPDHDEFQAKRIEHLVGLIMKYKRNCINTEEEEELDEWAVNNDANLRLFEELTDEASMKEALEWISGARTSQALKKLKGQLHFERPRRRFSILILLLHCAIAASVVMLLTISLLLIDKD